MLDHGCVQSVEYRFQRKGVIFKQSEISISAEFYEGV
jgi:hypothetical protein